jgi:hypothetical protein
MGGHIPEALALALHDAHDIKYAIETGTYKANTTRFLGEHFDRVWSIEMDENWHKRAILVLKNQTNVTLVLGDSRFKLREVLQELDGPALLWLDAHWCGGARPEQAPEEECPLREELYAIRENDNSHYILIDDARLFTGRPNYPHNPDLWPTWDGGVQALLPERYHTIIHNDVIVSVPQLAKGTVETWRCTP